MSTYRDYLAQGLCPRCKKNPIAQGRARCDPCLAHEAQWARERKNKVPRDFYLSQNICPRCHIRPLVLGRRHCEHCLSDARQQQDTKRKKSASQELCRTCTKRPAAEGHTECADCAARRCIRSRSWRVEHKYTHCSSCRGPLDDPRFAGCSRCRKEQTEDVKRTYHERISQGLCPDCGKPHDPISPSSRLCSECWQNSRSRRMHSYSNHRYGGQLETIIHRDKSCVVCGHLYGVRKNPVVCHHIDGNIENNYPDNLVLLCRKCHAAIEGWISCPDKQRLQQFLQNHYPI